MPCTALKTRGFMLQTHPGASLNLNSCSSKTLYHLHQNLLSNKLGRRAAHAPSNNLRWINCDCNCDLSCMQTRDRRRSALLRSADSTAQQALLFSIQYDEVCLVNSDILYVISHTVHADCDCACNSFQIVIVIQILNSDRCMQISASRKNFRSTTCRSTRTYLLTMHTSILILIECDE